MTTNDTVEEPTEVKVGDTVAWDTIMGSIAAHVVSVQDDTFVTVVMVGDDAEHLVDRAYLETVDDDQYCGTCGQMGCTANG